MNGRGVFPFRFRGTCGLEPGLDGEVNPQVVSSAGGLHECVLEVGLEVSVDVASDAEDLDSGDSVLSPDAHP